MLAKVFEGRLTHVNSDKGQIQIEDLVNRNSISLHINDKTQHHGWDKLIGNAVEAIVIDGKVTKVNLIEDL
jgi:hypothetical protein